jgi:hypothetical protein
MVEPLSVQYCIDLRGQGCIPSPCPGPSGTKRFGGPAPAKETWAVTCRQRDRLVQKEKLGPTAAAHYLAPLPLIFGDTKQPCLGRPTPLQQRLGRRVMNDATVPSEQAALGYGDDIAERSHPVL